MIGLAVCVGLLIIFHRPILLAIGRKIVLRYAAKENLKVDFRVEGNPFSISRFEIFTRSRLVRRDRIDRYRLSVPRLQFVRICAASVFALLQDVEVRGATLS